MSAQGEKKSNGKKLPKSRGILGKKAFLEDTEDPVLREILKVDWQATERRFGGDSADVRQFPEWFEFRTWEEVGW